MNVGEWHQAAAAAFEALEAQIHRLPDSWRHLHHSVRCALGEASGAVAFADRTMISPDLQLSPYCATWAAHADDYLTYSMRNLREWRDNAPRRRGAPQLLAFDPWLATGDRLTEGCGCPIRCTELAPS